MDRALPARLLSVDARIASVGVALRRARLELGRSPSEVAEHLHVPVRYIDAIEGDDFSSLPPSVYTRGLMRSYARLVGLNPMDFAGESIPIRPQDRNPIRPAVQPLEKPPLISWRFLLVVAAVIAAGGLFFYLYSQYNTFTRSVELDGSGNIELLPTPATRTIASQLLTPFPTTTPGPTATALPAPTPIQGLMIETRVSDRSWLQVWADERSVLAEPIPGGSTRTFTAEKSIRMRVGNAGAVDVTVNNVHQGKLGAPGQVLDVSWGRE